VAQADITGWGDGAGEGSGCNEQQNN